jgi:hypothetical protein
LVIKIFLFASQNKKKKKKKRKRVGDDEHDHHDDHACLMMMMMVMMRVCWARGPEEVRLLGFFTEFAAHSFFLSLGSSSSVFDRFQVLFCFVLLLLLLLETNFMFQIIIIFS